MRGEASSKVFLRASCTEDLRVLTISRLVAVEDPAALALLPYACCLQIPRIDANATSTRQEHQDRSRPVSPRLSPLSSSSPRSSSQRRNVYRLLRLVPLPHQLLRANRDRPQAPLPRPIPLRRRTSRSKPLLLLQLAPANSAPQGVRRILELVTGQHYPRDALLPVEKIDSIRLSTTVATNALLERQGAKHALVVTKGFKDLLEIGNQSRPKIFELNIRRPGVLYSKVVEVDERVTLMGYTSDPRRVERAVKFSDDGKVDKGYDGETHEDGEIVRGLSGEAVRILKRVDEDAVRKQLQEVYNEGYRSLAIVFMHSFTYPGSSSPLHPLPATNSLSQTTSNSSPPLPPQSASRISPSPPSPSQ